MTLYNVKAILRPHYETQRLSFEYSLLERERELTNRQSDLDLLGYGECNRICKRSTTNGWRNTISERAISRQSLVDPEKEQKNL